MESLNLRFAIGNRKIGRDTLIINMGTAKECPVGRAGLCPLFTSGRCYAMKAERQYKQVLPYRRAQRVYWLSSTAQEITADILAVLEHKPSVRFIRFNEAGDFHGQACVDKLSEIAGALAGRVKVFTYTHREDLDFSRLHDNLTVNGSGFMVHNNFTTVKEHSPEARIRCAGDCSTCKICYGRRGAIIEVKQH